MAVETLSCQPSEITSGDTVRFEIRNPDFPAADWTLAFVLSRPGSNPVSTNATESGEVFTVELSAAVTAALTAGNWRATHVFTDAGSERTSVDADFIFVAPNPTVALPTSTNATILAAIETAIQSLDSGTIQSASVNGESYTKKDMEQLFRLREQFKALVANEQAALGLKKPNRNRLLTRFV